MSAAEARAVAGKPVAHVYDAAYAGVPNWDIGRPQRPFVHLEEIGRISGPVLDVGCGTGELSLFLARHGYDVLGIDVSSRAVRQAREKARWRRIDARFLVWDALEAAALRAGGLTFRTVVDSAMYHVFGPADRDRFVDGLASVLRPGGRYFVLGDAKPTPEGTYGITPAELRGRFRSAEGWTVEFVVETVIERRYSRSPRTSRVYAGIASEPWSSHGRRRSPGGGRNDGIERAAPPDHCTTAKACDQVSSFAPTIAHSGTSASR